MNAEKQIEQIEHELKAIKASFEQSATMMEMYTYETTFSTSMNAITITPPQSYDPSDWIPLWLPTLDSDKTTRCGVETIEVTFNCNKGINTFAMLEIEKKQFMERVAAPITTRRIPYSGGARWLVTAQPNLEMVGTLGYYSWKTTILRLVVKSMAQGTVGVKMLWQ